MANIRDNKGYPVLNFPWGVSIGSYPGIVANKIYGHNNAAPVLTETIIWNSDAPHAFPTSADIGSMALVSKAGTDNTGGTGARKVQISGLDFSLAQITEVVSMNGETPVPLQETFYRINKMEVVETGANEWNNGDVYLGTGVFSDNQVPEIAFGFIEDSRSVSQSAFFTIPGSQTGYFAPDMFTIEEGKAATISLSINKYLTNSKLKVAQWEWVVSIDSELFFPLEFDAGDDVFLTTEKAEVSTDIGIAFDIITIENGLLDNTTRKF